MKRVYPITIQSGAAQTGNHILMLLEPEGNRQVPIIIGQSEAQGILLAKQNVATRRPLTHQLMVNTLEAYGLSIVEVTIDRVVEGIFYATLHLTDGFNRKDIDCRTTDAISLALLTDAPIMMDDTVIEETSMRVESSTEKTDTPTLKQLQEELQRCEETEDYERAAEIQKQIEQMNHEL